MQDLMQSERIQKLEEIAEWNMKHQQQQQQPPIQWQQQSSDKKNKDLQKEIAAIKTQLIL